MAPTICLNGIQTEKNVFHQQNRDFFGELSCFRSGVFLKFPLPTDLSFSYDCLLYFGDNKVYLAHVSLLFCIAS